MRMLASGQTRTTSLDPVCAMTVAVDGAPVAAAPEGIEFVFYCPGCRARFEADPAGYLTADTP